MDTKSQNRQKQHQYQTVKKSITGDIVQFIYTGDYETCKYVADRLSSTTSGLEVLNPEGSTFYKP